jgi:hypothetical protein
MDYGILAAYAYRTQLGGEAGWTQTGGTVPTGYQNLPPSIQSVYQLVYAPTIQDSVGTGKVQQGQAGGANCYAIMAQDTRDGRSRM